MKMLISDYDNTINPFGDKLNFFKKKLLDKNIEAINKFIENGNIFVIATGRNTSSIKNELKKYNINYNYLISYNGRVILDKFDNVVYANYLNSDTIEYFSNNDLIRECHKYDEFKENSETSKAVYLRVKLECYLSLREYIIHFKAIYPNLKMSPNILLKSIDIRNEFTKSDGIKELIKRENIDIKKEDIYSVGDGLNDFEMLRDYNGYRMKDSNSDLEIATNKTTRSINKLIKTIEKNV